MAMLSRKLAVFLSVISFTLLCMACLTYYMEIKGLQPLPLTASVKQDISRPYRLFGTKSTSSQHRKDLPLCPELPDHLDHKVDPELRLRELNLTGNRSRVLDGVAPGGSYTPLDCTPRHHTAILVPYRNRTEHLRKFLLYMHAFLQKQKIRYTIFVTEQSGNSTFNIGLLHNVGFTFAEKTANFTCYVIHDVDLLPVNETHIYKCTDVPQHFCHINTKFGTKGILYGGYFGGVLALTRRQYKEVNGYSNIFIGWGGEDDEFLQRVQLAGYKGEKKWTRVPAGVGYYYSFQHTRDKGNSPNPERMKLISTTNKRWQTEGLNSLHKMNYTQKAVELRDLYTWVLVDIDQQAVIKTKSAILKSLQDKQHKPTNTSKPVKTLQSGNQTSQAITSKPVKPHQSGNQTEQAMTSKPVKPLQSGNQT